MAKINRLKEIINREVSEFKHKAQLSIARAVLLNLNNSQKRQLAQVGLLAEEEHDDVERFEAYGFTGNPFPGAEGIALSIGGDRDNAVIVAMDNKEHRPTSLEEGEACVYTDEGQHLTARRGKLLEVGEDDDLVSIAKGGDFVALAAKVDLELGKIQAAFDAHTHVSVTSLGTPTPPVPLVGAISSTAATKVRAT